MKEDNTFSYSSAWQPSWVSTDLASRRYVLLIKQLDAVYAHGQKSELTRLLHISQPSISRIRGGRDLPRRDTIAKATKPPLSLHPSFFWIRTSDEEPHYSKVRGMRSVPEDFKPAALERFARAAPGIGVTVAESEMDFLLGIPWPGEPTEQAYFLALQALRTIDVTEPTDTPPTSDPPP